MYRCHETFNDGLPVHFRSTDLNLEECVQSIMDRDLSYDVVLVDSFHEYETSYRDLKAAFALIKPYGTVIVHDCIPPNEKLAYPKFFHGSWCGVTYKAYLDFVTTEPDLEYCTIDTDYGCGVIRWARSVEVSESIRHQRLDATVPTHPSHNEALTAEKSRLIARWKSVGSDYEAAFRIFQENQRLLLNVVRVADFLRAERNGASLLTQAQIGQAWPPIAQRARRLRSPHSGRQQLRGEAPRTEGWA
jgi:hypothetical protein